MVFAPCSGRTKAEADQPDVIEETLMTTLATQPTSRTRARLTAVASRVSGDEGTRIEIVENPIHRVDAALAAAVEARLIELLRDERLGTVNVRFRVCRDEADSFQFICKIENPPTVDADVLAPWRWWSPLMSSAQDFSAALEDGLRIRRSRLIVDTPR
jgi:hypothetical protein